MVRAGFDLSQIGARPSPAKGDTTYIAAIDQEGRGASLITSLFGDFGAHLGIPELGGADRQPGHDAARRCGCR